MTVRVTREFRLPCVVALDAEGRVTHAYVVPERAELMVIVEEAMTPGERLAIVHDATRSRLDDGLVRVRQGIDTVSYWRLVRLTRTQAILHRPETGHEVRFNLKRGWQVGEDGYSAPRIHDEELRELRSRTERGAR